MLHRIYQTIFSKKILKVIFFIAVVAFAFSLYCRYIQDDEPWFGEQAYWLAKEGNVKLKSMPGIFNWTEDMLIYHKLFVWLGAVLIFFFGWNIYLFKGFILLCFLGCTYWVVRYIRRVGEPEEATWISLLLLFLTPELIHRSFMFRPEVLIMLLGFASFYHLKRFVENKLWSGAVIGGIFAGLAFLTHLNALVFVVSGFVFLLTLRRWKGVLIFSVVAGTVCLVYLWGLWEPGAIETYRFQLLNWPTHQSAFGSKVSDGILGSIMNNLLRLLNEHKRYFWDQDVWGISTLFLVALIARFKYLLKEQKNLTIYTLILTASLGVLTSGHSPRYLVYIMPFMILIVAFVLCSLKFNTEKKWFLKGVFLLFFTAYLAFSSVALVKIFKRNRGYIPVHNKLLSEINQNFKVLAPWEVIYNGIKTHQIHSFKTYEYIEDQEKRKLSQLEFLHLANRFDMDYIILDQKRKTSDTFDWFAGWNLEPNPYFVIHDQVGDYLILRRKSDQ